jgi:hypothetical protein
MSLDYIKSLLGEYIVVVAAAGVAVVLVLFIMNIVSLVKINKMKKKYNSFMEGSDGKTLEDTIISRFRQVDDLRTNQELQGKDIDALKVNILKTYQKFGLVKYDAFNEMGGQLSFSLAMLDKNNNGFLLNTVHNREGSYTYVKEITDGKSEINLSEEEERALNKAVNVK